MKMQRPSMNLSVVIPLYNEAQNIGPLVTEIHRALEGSGRRYEIICVNDGSTDDTASALEIMANQDPALVVLLLYHRVGQTAALQAGLDAARGDTVALMDGDGQNDPADLPAMLGRLSQGYDLVAGWRRVRRDRWLTRVLPSKFANALIGGVTGVRLRDHGCTLKVMRAEVAKALHLYSGLHRYVAVLARSKGARICEMQVNHRPRTQGQSKYGLGRTFRVLMDLLLVSSLYVYGVRPLYVLGGGGVLSGLCGAAICGWLAAEKLLFGAALAQRPLLLLGALLIVVGVQLVSLGLVAELVARGARARQDKQGYIIGAQWVGPGQTASGALNSATHDSRASGPRLVAGGAQEGQP